MHTSHSPRLQTLITVACLLVISITALASCNQINNKVVYVHVRVAGQEFWVPRQYFLRVFPRSFDERAISIHLIYPEFEPLSPNAGKVRKRERWFDRVSILVKEKAEKETPEGQLEWTKDFFRITKKMDDKYGLTYLAPLPLTGEEELYVLKNKGTVHIRA
jgi:hypothetical protein